MEDVEKKDDLNIEEKDTKNLEQEQSKQLKVIIIGIIFLFVMVGAFYLIYDSIVRFKYNGMEFEKIKIGDLRFYKVSFPLFNKITGQYAADYNLFLRNDPRTLENIPVDRPVNLKKDLIFTSEELICNDNSIALANFVQFLGNVGSINVVANNSYECSDAIKSLATWVRVENSSENRIKKIDDNCYILKIKDCAILNVTEKFIIEAAISN